MIACFNISFNCRSELLHPTHKNGVSHNSQYQLLFNLCWITQIKTPHSMLRSGSPMHQFLMHMCISKHSSSIILCNSAIKDVKRLIEVSLMCLFEFLHCKCWGHVTRQHMSILESLGSSHLAIWLQPGLPCWWQSCVKMLRRPWSHLILSALQSRSRNRSVCMCSG